MREFGLLGKNISYSFSEKYFSDKFKSEAIADARYQVFDFQDVEKIETLFNLPNLKGFNVTIPYKESIIPYLDKVHPIAQEIGAVNTVKIENGQKIGYNTDAYGFEKSLLPMLEFHHRSALIFGDGGAAKAIKFVLKKHLIAFQSVNRKGEFTYSDLTEKSIEKHSLLINTTPVGTFPHVEETLPIPYQFLDSQHLLFDLVYNPEKTKFLEYGESQGAKIKNGMEMLIFQAEKSWEIWNQTL